MRKLYLIFLIIGACFFTTEAQDWANLERFKEANEKLAPSMECNDRVVFMGNSITQGWIDQVPLPQLPMIEMDIISKVKLLMWKK